MPLPTVDAFVDNFLKGRDLESTICTLCNAREQLCTDPISDTLSIMLNSTISVSITETGMSLFKGHPTMVIPFNRMTKLQLQFLDDTVRESMHYKSGGHSTSGHTAAVQMGGGSIILVNTAGTDTVAITFLDVIKSFISLLKNSQVYDTWSQRAICQIVLQRLSATTVTSQDVIRVCSEYIETEFSQI